MISRIDHVSIAVRDKKKAEHFFRDILGAVEGAGAEDSAMHYCWQLFSLGDLSRLEIISPTAAGSFLDGFLASRDAGVHHITLQTPDLEKVMSHLKRHNVPFFGHHDYGQGIWKEIFIHPRHAMGVLLQIAEFRPDDWLSDTIKFPANTKWEVKKTQAGGAISFAHPGGGTVSIELTRDEMNQLSRQLGQALV